MDEIDIARSERDTLRWILLAALSRAEPYGTNEYVLLRTAQDLPLRVTPDQVRRELSYIEKRKLVTLDTKQPRWHAQITADGIDIVDYRAECPAGIARPSKW